MFKFKGIVYKVGNTEVISDKFSKRELVLTDAADQYPQYISFTFVKDKCALLDNLAEGLGDRGVVQSEGPWVDQSTRTSKVLQHSRRIRSNGRN